MANTEKFSRIIEYKGTFDASAIISNFKKLENELRKRGSNEADVLNLDGEVKKVEQLNKTIQKIISKGFKTPKEFNEFSKMTTQMSTSLSRLSEEFQNIDASNISNALKSSTAQTKLLEQKTKELIKDYERSVKQVFKEGEARQKILEATRQNINNLKAGKQAENDIAALYKQELALQQEKVNQSEKDLQNEKENLRVLKEKKEQLQDIKSFSQQSSAFGNVFLQAGNYQKVSTQNGQEIRTALSNADMQNVYSSISKAFSGKGDLDALSRALKQYNIELVEGAKDAALFTNAAKEFNSALKSNNQSIKESESKQKELERTWQESLEAFQKLNIALGEGDKFGQGTLFTNLDLAVNSMNQLANAQQRMATANANANKPLSGLTENISLQNQLNSSIEQGIEATRATIKEQKNLDSAFDQLSNRFKYLFSFMSMWHAGMRTVKQTFEDIKGIDKAFASIAMVTDYDISGLWKQYDDYAKIANELGQSTESVIQSSALYYQQGLQTQEVLSLTKDTMKLATLANINFSDSTKLMTSALRSFHMEMEEGTHITDVYSELAAHAAADVKGIAYAMSKTASIAASAGMDFEKLSAMLTTMIEVTQEAPENLGTAMKSVVARFTEVKKNVSDIEGDIEDMDINKVDAALKSVGISLKDQAGQIRDLDDVFLELSAIWNDLDRNSQRYIATIAAGSRQQSRFIALMENYERTMQLIEIAQDSAGRSSEQFAKYADSVENKVNKLKNTWEQFRINLVDEKTYKKILDFANQALQKFSKVKLPQIAGITVWGMTIGKNLINSIIEGLRSGRNALSLGFESIITQLKTGKTKIEIQTNIDQIKNVDIPAVQQKIEELKNKPIQLHVPSETETRLFGIEASLNKFGYTLDKTRTDLNLFDLTSETASQDLRKLFDQYNFGTAAYYALDNAIRENKKEIEQHDQAVVNEQRHLEGLNAQVQNYQNQLIKSKNLTMVGNAIGSAMGTAATMAFTGTFDAEQIAQSVGIQFAATGISTFTNAISSALAGTASFAAAGGPAGLIISVLSLLATFVLPKLISAIKKVQEARRLENDEAYRTEKQYEKLKEKSDALAESLDKQKKKYEEISEKQKNIKEAQSTFEELSSKIILTEEEQEKLNEATTQLAEQFPELISYYDAQGNAVITINDNYKKLLKSQEESYLWEKKKTELATINKISADYDTNQAEYEKLQAKINDFYLRPIEQQGDTWYQDTSAQRRTYHLDESLFVIFQSLFSAGIGQAQNDYEEQGQAFLQTVQNLFEGYDELTVEDLMKSQQKQEEVWNLINKNQEKFIEKYKEIYSKATFTSEEMDIYSNFSGQQEELLQDLVNVVNSNFETAIDEAALSSDIEDKSFLKTLLLNKFTLTENIKRDFEQRVKREGMNESEWLKDVIGTQDIEQYINELNTKITPELEEKIKDFYNNLKALTNKERQQIIEEMPEGQIKEQLEQQSQQIQQEIIDQARKIEEKTGLSGKIFLSKNNSLEVINQLATKVENDFDFDGAGEDAGKKYVLAFEDAILKYNLSEAAKSWLLSIDWQSMDWIHLEAQLKTKAEEMTQQGFASTEEIAYKILNNIVEQVGKTNLRIISDFTTVGNVEALTETANTAFEILQDQMDNFTPVFRVGLEADEAQLTQEEYDKFTKAIKTIMNKKDSPWAGLFDINKYTAYDENGKVFLTNLKELRDILFDKAGPLAGLDELKKKRDELQQAKDAGQIIDTEMLYAINAAIDSFEEIDKYEKQFTENARKAVTTFRDIEKAVNSIASDYQSIVNEQKENGFLSSKSLEGFLSNIDTLNEQLDKTSLSNKKLDVNSILTRNKKGYVISTAALRNYITELIKATMATDGLSEEDEHLHERLQAILDDLNAFELERLKKAQEEALKAAKKKEEELQKAAEDAQKAMEDAQKAAEDAQKDADEAKEKIKEAEKALSEAQEKVSEKYKDIEEKQKKVIDLQEELNKLLYGTGDSRKSTLDGLYNYEQRLSAINNTLEDVKSSLEDINNVNLRGSVYEYGAIMHSRKATLMSQQGVYSNNLSAIKAEISPYAAYFTEVNGRLLADVAKINAAQMNDKYKDWLESQISAYNDSVDKIHEIKKEIESVEKEFTDFQRTYRDKYINLQETVIETLKEEAQEELNVTKEKYAAMEEADNDYIAALEEAINKQRELRQLEQETNELSEKEKKLSLLKRDTSGTRQKDVLKQQKDIEKSRQSLLDKNVDNIIKNLKELYKQQKEARDAEIQYQEQVLQNATYIEEANAIIQSWGTADEMIGWFIDHNQKTQEMTAEQLEKYSEDLAEMYNAREIYMTTSMKDFSEMLNVQQDEINQITTETAEHLTSETHRSFEEVKKEVDEAIEKAREDLNEAMDALREAKDELVGLLDDVKLKLDGVKQAQLDAATAANLAAEANRNLAASKDALREAENKYEKAKNEREQIEQNPQTTVSDTGNKGSSYKFQGNDSSTETGTDTSSLSNILTEVAQVALSVPTVVGSNSDTSTQKTSSVQNTDFNQGKMAEYESDIIKQIKAARTNSFTSHYSSGKIRNMSESEISSLIAQLSAMNLNGIWDKKNKKFIWTDSFSNAQSYISNKPLSERGGLVAFAKGGLVNYTGPAWVDGTPAQPEAFLSAEDTRNIAHFTDVLSSLYNSFGQFNPSVSSNHETVINVTVNVDGVSSDYDVDQAVERVKQSIIDAANQTGSTVILHQ